MLLDLHAKLTAVELCYSTKFSLCFASTVKSSVFYSCYFCRRCIIYNIKDVFKSNWVLSNAFLLLFWIVKSWTLNALFIQIISSGTHFKCFYKNKVPFEKCCRISYFNLTDQTQQFMKHRYDPVTFNKSRFIRLHTEKNIRLQGIKQ